MSEKYWIAPGLDWRLEGRIRNKDGYSLIRTWLSVSGTTHTQITMAVPLARLGHTSRVKVLCGSDHWQDPKRE